MDISRLDWEATGNCTANYTILSLDYYMRFIDLSYSQINNYSLTLRATRVYLYGVIKKNAMNCFSDDFQTSEWKREIWQPTTDPCTRTSFLKRRERQKNELYIWKIMRLGSMTLRTSEGATKNVKKTQGRMTSK